MEEDLGGVGGGVGCGNRTLIETFFACIRVVDLIRARMQSILASRMQESTKFIRT
jgi:predicted ATPase